MTVRTSEQYIESIRESRVVWIEGQRVRDVTRHPHLRICAELCAIDCVLSQDPRYRELLIERDDGVSPTTSPSTHGEFPRYSEET